MPALRDIALTVEERGPNQYFWVLLEAFNSDAVETIHYQRIHIASVAQTSYSSALVMGANALRKLVDSNSTRLDTGF
ncbi:hypothetical protein QTI24_06340 [Variovorax sp. J22P240]|uniref:hypothetical protein n=1 Tax=unclassified Variovorax TaxID=663243 RepID=UPI0025756383|nr:MULTISPECIES: hypothetical protein [unclassified Variovorax]MDL9998214.1 hypothetical protein [Variovorax sp. J22P240]MDM0048529.1 hypothetical protein [Variovorax sp. J22R115]